MFVNVSIRVNVWTLKSVPDKTRPKKIAEGGVCTLEACRRRPSFCYSFLPSKSIAEM